MTLTERHRWCCEKIFLCFEWSDVSEDEARSFVERPEVASTLTNFFLGENTGAIFVHFQVPPKVDKTNTSGLFGIRDIKEAIPQLFLSDGKTVAVKDKVCYFHKRTKQAVECSHFDDTSILYGELTENLPRDMALILSAILDAVKWPIGVMGNVAQETVEEVLADGKKFVAHLDQMQNNSRTRLILSANVVLGAPKVHDLTPVNVYQQVQQNPEVLEALAVTLNGWCDQVDLYLNTQVINNPSFIQGKGAATDSGPQVEIDFWLHRAQTLSGASEQMRGQHCSHIVSLIKAIVNVHGDSAFPTIGAPLKRWKTLYCHVIDSANEAKDNKKFLRYLQPLMVALYSGNVQNIITILPSLVKSIGMIYTTSRYYDTQERMTTLFSKVTEQMVKSCQLYILDAAEGGSLWDCEFSALNGRLSACKTLNEEYRKQYGLTKAKLLEKPSAEPFDYPETHLFGKFDLFCRRVTKLQSLFSIIEDFSGIVNTQLEGMGPFVELFLSDKKQFQLKGHDLLDYHHNKFDRDLVEFNHKIEVLEIEMIQFLNQSFERPESMSRSLDLFKTFYRAMKRKRLQNVLKKVLFDKVFKGFWTELENVEKIFDKNRKKTPGARYSPPIAGRIAWVRHLFRKIHGPFQYFQHYTTVMEDDDAKEMMTKYYRVANKLRNEEESLLRRFSLNISNARRGFEATLLVRNPGDKQLYVNFDSQIFESIRETKCLSRMGVENIPESAKIVLIQELKLKAIHRNLSWALAEYDRLIAEVAPSTQVILLPHFRNFEFQIMRLGIFTLTWTSTNVEDFILKLFSALQSMKELIKSINDIIENRIEENLVIVARTLLVDLPDTNSFALSDFVEMQQKHIARQSTLLQGKNIEIMHAVDDLIFNIQQFKLEGSAYPVKDEEVKNLREHYNESLYGALLVSAKTSMNALKRRIGSRGGSNILSISKAFFDANVLVTVTGVSLLPSLDDIQQCINQSAQAILSCYKCVFDWSANHEGNKVSFFVRITKDIELVRVALLLTGCVQGVRKTVIEYVNSFKRYDWLSDMDKDAECHEFSKGCHNLSDFKRKFQEFDSLEKEIDTLPSKYIIGALSLNPEGVKSHCKNECKAWIARYTAELHKKFLNALDSITEYIRQTQGKLGREVKELDSLGAIVKVLNQVKEREACIEMELFPIQQMYDMLKKNEDYCKISKEDDDKMTRLELSWKKLVLQAQERADELRKTQLQFKTKLIQDIKSFKIDVVQFRQRFRQDGPLVKGLAPNDASHRLKSFKDEYESRKRKYITYRLGEELFAFDHQDYPDLEETQKEIELASQLFDLYTDVDETISKWRFRLWSAVVLDVDNMLEVMEAYDQRCKRLPKRLREFDAHSELRSKIDEYQTLLPLLKELSKESIKRRHWDAVVEKFHVKIDFDEVSDFQLRVLVEANLISAREEIEEITEGADKQLKLEEQLDEIQRYWIEQRFELQEWKSRGIYILRATPKIAEELEETIMNLQTILSNRHIGPFEKKAIDQKKLLWETSDTLEKLVKVQNLWCALESVFTGGDIAKQMPKEAKRFAKVDKDWAKIMSKVTDTENVVEACGDEYLRTSLPNMHLELEKCEKSLKGYLGQKQNAFPRFFFVSDAKLLQILSKGSDPLAMNQYYESVFDAIQTVQHDKKDKTIITKFNGVGGEGQEVVSFVSVVKAIGNIEEWLVTLVSRMQSTMKEHARKCAGGVSDVSADISKLRPLVDVNIAQFALLAVQILWTYETQTALELCRSKQGVMNENNLKQQKVLEEMSGWCLQDLGTKVNRRKIETLVTVHVHQRDIAEELLKLYKAKKVQRPSDFDWLKQARFYWKPNARDDVSDDGATIVSITDVDFPYQYEYLGAKERLVITPLTDKCYITLAQALGMYFGGAPAGPAGTGKTETTKDLGNTLGTFVVVTNCTDQMKYSDCAKIFKGLCQSGLWGCFDEFNRIKLPVLSVVAQQVLAIQNAQKQRSKTFQFPGDPQDVNLKPACAFFITMNPGYAGRQELPENLKALFRGVAMMTPDFQIIKKVKMCSVGYKNFDVLSKKFHALYSTCKEQLSNQRHYDWGLRNILSVLRTMGAVKRANLNQAEDFLVYQTIRDMNLSKLVAQDVPLFKSLLLDLFPGIATPPKGSYPDEEQILRNVVEDQGLIYHSSWVLKVIQLYETTRVRHGIMLVGPSGGGKTCILNCLKATLEKHHNIKYKEARFNPKAMRAQEMYGEIDPQTEEWTTGVFAAMWERYNKRENEFNTWIVADGPVDAIWIEDLNTVLDDNKILTLANGDRMPMTDNVKMMFEVETLVNASPATVSRAGIIYVSDTDLDWSPVMEAWLKNRVEERQAILRSLVLKWIGSSNQEIGPGPCFEFLSKNTAEVMKEGRVGRITSFCDLFLCLTEKSDCSAASAVNLPRSILEKIFLYCLCWSVASLLETEDRKKFDSWLRSKDTNSSMPLVSEGETVYEYHVDIQTGEWKKWNPPTWTCPNARELNFSSILIPTLDSTRAKFVIENIHAQNHPVLLLGAEGTAKTSVLLMFLADQDPKKTLIKRINFSSATTPFMAQFSIENELDKRGGKTFGPPRGKKMTVFFDDISMPEVNKWGDQPTLELVRLLVEQKGFYFLDKDKRGDFKTCEDLNYVAAMQHPGGGKNDIPIRLKRNFFVFNLVLPSITSINDIYGQMLSGRFTSNLFDAGTMEVQAKLTQATISLWELVKRRLLPTPSKFHYVFNMRDLSRVFQGILKTPTASITTGGIGLSGEEKKNFNPSSMLIGLWKHESDRVFCDKLVNIKDKDEYEKIIGEVGTKIFGKEFYSKACNKPIYMVSFLRDDKVDEDGMVVEAAPKLYEDGGGLENILNRAKHFLTKYNDEFPAKKLDLVLFQDALRHMLRISRLIDMPRGSALLVGVGGSGKQSLARLASYISGAQCFQITLTKQYNEKAFFEDIKKLYERAGHKRKPTTFLFTESEIKDEVYLETINSILSTGEVPGLFAKDEMMTMTSDLHQDFARERPHLEETSDNLKEYFTDCVRDNLHIILSMSPLNPKFPVRARKFPSLISSPTIDWFLPWPEEALVSVSSAFLKEFQVDCTSEIKQKLMSHMGSVHKKVTQTCDEYFKCMRRQVYQTPKSFLSFINAYKKLYERKLFVLNDKENQVGQGLRKLIQGAKDVEEMKVSLKKSQAKIAEKTEETNKSLEDVKAKKAEAEREEISANAVKAKCQQDAESIAITREICNSELEAAMPHVREAETAINGIGAKDIGEIKKLANPSDIIKLVFDCVLVLFQKPLKQVTPCSISLKKQQVAWYEPSFKPQALQMMNGSDLLGNLKKFGEDGGGRDKMNDETIEFLSVYITELKELGFNPDQAQKASKAAKGLCVYVQALEKYHNSSKVVKPKQEKLAVAEAKQAAADHKLKEMELKVLKLKETLEALQKMADGQLAEKNRMEEKARQVESKMTKASQLINGLADERQRWTEDAKNFQLQKSRLVGDCALGCAFVSYCGPFNQAFRDRLVNDTFMSDCEQRGMPFTQSLDITSFLADSGTTGNWNLQGLPTDSLSIQNGILVTSSTRYPLLIDPQGQAQHWICNKEGGNLPSFADGQILVQLNDAKLKDKLAVCMADGKTMVVVGVGEEIDPLLNPVLEKEISARGNKKFIVVGDTKLDFDDSFNIYFITRLSNPKFSPELQAKTTLIDFTVTQKGLEDQLLARVIGKEQKALEEQLSRVLQEVVENNNTLVRLNASLLKCLSENTGNLLDDEELVSVLENTKAKSAEVSLKLNTADEAKRSIDEKREQFRPVATRGSVLYFSVVSMGLVNSMYQTSLAQFLVLFSASMDKSEKSELASKRVANIIETLSFGTYRYINRGLFERDKLTFKLLVAMKILVSAKHLKEYDIPLFLKAGASLDINNVRSKPFQWMSSESWLNVVEISQKNKFFVNLIGDISGNENAWKRWYTDNEPETLPIPDYQQRIDEQRDIGPFLKLLLVRCLRFDRSNLMCTEFLRDTMGFAYVQPVTDTMEMLFDDMVAEVPVIFLLSRGADPTEGIETLSRKRKVSSPAVISLGEGQEIVAKKAVSSGSENGTWVLLQNCELALELMTELEDILKKLRVKMDPNFRLFITALPHPSFPLGLLQMSTKVTNEPPSGLKAGLLRSYTPGIMVDQDRIERHETENWRRLLFTLCFLHSVVQERRKFGPIGWCVPYEYNDGDLQSCILFLEKHMENGPISWTTFQYMVSAVQYGGKITDSIDTRLFRTYTEEWLRPQTTDEGFTFNPAQPLSKIPGGFQYIVPAYSEHGEYQSYISAFPAIDSPEICGLHPNADLSFRKNEADALIQSLLETQPKEGGGGIGGSREEFVFEKCKDLLNRLPEDYVEDVYKEQLKKLGDLKVPMNIFLFQEVQRLQNVIGKVRHTLTQLQLAINGEVVMTSELQEMLDSIYDAKVPYYWENTLTGDEFSWRLSSLGDWFGSLLNRDKQNRTWLTNGRPKSFWLTGFFNPNGCLTAMKQEVTRKHEGWALDDVVYHTDVTSFERPEQLKQSPDEGIYVHGLFLEGAQWDRQEGNLSESEPKQLFTMLPILYITGVKATEEKNSKKSLHGAGGPYLCPLYKYKSRTDRNFIFNAQLKCPDDKAPSHWILRGVALLCNT